MGMCVEGWEELTCHMELVQRLALFLLICRSSLNRVLNTMCLHLTSLSVAFVDYKSGEGNSNRHSDCEGDCQLLSQAAMFWTIWDPSKLATPNAHTSLAPQFIMLSEPSLLTRIYFQS